MNHEKARDKSGITRHLKKILSNEELSKQATVAKFATVQEGCNENTI